MTKETPAGKALQHEYARETFGIDYPVGSPHIPETQVGDYQTDEAIDLQNRLIYTKLLYRGDEIANNHPRNRDRHRHFLSKAHGRILISGLGLGETLFELITKPEVEYIRIIELEQEIIKIIAPLVSGNEKVEILQGDIFEYRPADGEHFDFIYHAIWNDKKEGTLAKRKRLQSIFSNYSDWHGFVFFPGKGGPRSKSGRKRGIKVGPIKDPDEQRTVRKGIRFTSDEYYIISKAAEAARLTESTIMQRGAVAEAERVLREVAALSDPDVRAVLSRRG